MFPVLLCDMMAFEVFEATRPAGIVLYGRLGWKETEVESYLHCLLEMAPGTWYHPKHARREKGPREF